MAEILSRESDPKPQHVANSILLQRHVLRTIYGDYRGFALMATAPRKMIFEWALLHVRGCFDQDIYQSFRHMMGCDMDTPMPQLPERNFNVEQPVYVCGNENCRKPTHKRCSKCKCVGYCSRECQVADWKRHKKVCSSKTAKDAKVTESADSVRRVASPALMRQEQLLKENPSCDYVKVLPSGRHDIGVSLGYPHFKLCFRVARANAPNEPV